MRYLGATTFLTLILSSGASAKEVAVPLSAAHTEPQQATYLLARGSDRHYSTRKYRKHHRYNNRRHHRPYRGYHRGFHLDHHYYPRYRYHYGYRYRARHHHGDYFKWLAGAIVVTELIHHTLDQPDYEYDQHNNAELEYDTGDHESHYRDYYNQKYKGH